LGLLEPCLKDSRPLVSRCGGPGEASEE
jgi:hypothetical protein